MGTRNEKPVRMAIHPGAILKEELRERKIKQRELAQTIGMQPSHLSEIIRGKRSITKSIADKLEDVLSIPSIDWMRLQLAYDYDMVGVPRETGRIEPVHPGKIIKAEVDRRNISLSALSQETGISSYQINELLAERMKLETDLAMMLEAAIGLDASWLMTIQNEYDMSVAERDVSFMEKLKHIRQLAAAFLIVALLCLAGPLWAQTGGEGYYKDIFMDSGIRLTSKSDLPVARYLDLSLERFISAVTKELTATDTLLQYATFVGSPIDENGVLLYPDGAPRFRMIYVNGGLATQHGRSLTPEGRARVKEYIDAGGSYLGSCAGAFLCGRYMDTIEVKPREYLNIWPGYGVDTGMSGTYTGMTLDKDSPLLKYNDFGGDHFVDSVFHNNGCYAVPLLEPGDAKTEVLLRYDADTMKLERPVHGRPSAWAYKQNERSGRVIAIGSHPESRAYGEILDLMAALVCYALDGNGETVCKGELKKGEARVMDRRTADKDPLYTRIGDRQYHHFLVNVPKGAKTVTVTLSTPAGWKDFDLYLFADCGKQAFKSSAPYKNVVLGSDKTLVIKDPKPGKLFISVFCATTVDTEETKYGERYTGRTDVLNGVPYTIQVDW